MPMDRRAAFQLGLLIMAVPTQYYLAKYMESSEKSRNNALQTIMSSAVSLRNKYFTWQSWQQWCLNLVSELQNKPQDSSPGDPPIPSGSEQESVAVEVLRYRENGNGHFASSTKPRKFRGSVKYRIGQVIKHKQWGYRGVIVGWDPTTKAPESWLQQNHPKDKPLWRKMPSYSILVDTHDRSQPQTTYVAQENIQIVSNTKVVHPELDDYFENYDGAQYLARPWLKTIYPRD